MQDTPRGYQRTTVRKIICRRTCIRKKVKRWKTVESLDNIFHFRSDQWSMPGDWRIADLLPPYYSRKGIKLFNLICLLSRVQIWWNASSACFTVTCTQIQPIIFWNSTQCCKFRLHLAAFNSLKSLIVAKGVIQFISSFKAWCPGGTGSIK